ncbi:MAG: hypothetical protein V1663_04455, partial [archaeon]
VTGFCLVLLKFNLLKQFALIMAFLLLIKSLMFLGNLVSFIDIFCVIVIVFAFMGFYGVITWIVVVWLIQKGIFSLFA